MAFDLQHLTVVVHMQADSGQEVLQKCTLPCIQCHMTASGDPQWPAILQLLKQMWNNEWKQATPTHMCHHSLFLQSEKFPLHMFPLLESSLDIRSPRPRWHRGISTVRVQGGQQVGVECKWFPRGVYLHTQALRKLVSGYTTINWDSSRPNHTFYAQGQPVWGGSR